MLASTTTHKELGSHYSLCEMRNTNKQDQSLSWLHWRTKFAEQITTSKSGETGESRVSSQKSAYSEENMLEP